MMNPSAILLLVTTWMAVLTAQGLPFGDPGIKRLPLHYSASPPSSQSSLDRSEWVTQQLIRHRKRYQIQVDRMEKRGPAWVE